MTTIKPELSILLILVIMVLLYGIGWYLHLESSLNVYYKFCVIPVLVAVLSFSARYFAEPGASGVTLLFIMGCLGIVVAVVSFVGFRIIEGIHWSI